MKSKRQAHNPLILRCHRLMDAFAKSDEERDFYLDRDEGFIIFVNLDKEAAELSALEKELEANAERYCPIPKLTFFETKKIMEGFVNEKVYDIDTKEKLLDIIQSKEAREHFLEFIYDHHSELEKWQQFYQERWRIRIIEWLRRNEFQFVFEEDLDLSRKVIEKLKESLFEARVGKDIAAARKLLFAKAKTYYSNEALNPRPKRGRPPKQTVKLEIEPQVTLDIYTAVPASVRPFLFTPDISSASAVTFSSKFASQEEWIAARKSTSTTGAEATLSSLNQKLATLRTLSSRWIGASTSVEAPAKVPVSAPIPPAARQQRPPAPAISALEKPSKTAPLKRLAKATPKKRIVPKAAPKKALRKVMPKTPPKGKKAAVPPPPGKKKRLAPLARLVPGRKTIQKPLSRQKRSPK